MIPGTVKMSVTGEQSQRFLNLCRGRGMTLKKITQTGERELQLVLSVDDFFKIAPMRRKTGVHIHILKKSGPLFWILACRRNKILPVGVLLIVCVLFFLSGRVWNIHIEGNVLNPTPQLLEFLADKKVSCGMAKKKIHCSELAEAMRREFPEITWVSARLSGTTLSLEIREEDARIQVKEKDGSVSLFSTADGIVESIVTRQGTPLVNAGDEVKKGQELVSGIVNITDDGQEIVRYEYVRADADIYIRHVTAYYDTFPVSIKKKVYTGKEKKGIFFRTGRWILDLSPAEGKNEDRLTREMLFEPAENFRLPFSAGSVNVKKYKFRKGRLTEADAKKQVIHRLYLYEEKLIEKGVQISENNVKIEINQQDCVSRGTLTVTERAVQEAPTEKKTQPKERTPEDG